MQPEQTGSPEQAQPESVFQPPRRQHALKTIALLAMSVTVIGLAYAAALLVGKMTGQSNGTAGPPSGEEESEPGIVPRIGPESIAKWSKPELAIVLSGEMHGYLLPCGCSKPQIGGLERRYNFIQGLKEKGWPILAVDLGDIAQAQADVPSGRLENIQGLLKYITAMKALKTMNYAAIGIGARERALTTGDSQGLCVPLDNWALNERRPRILSANLQDRGEKERWMDMVGSWQFVTLNGSRLKVSVTGLVGKSERESDKVRGEKDVRWSNDNAAVLEAVLKEQENKKIDMRVLLYQGTVKEAEELLKRFPQFHLVLCKSDDPLAPEKPKRVGNSLIVTVGEKGKDIGVIGVFQQDKPDTYEMRYQLVEMDPSLATPEGQEKNNPILKLLEDYTKEMADHPQQYLLRYKQVRHPMQIQFDTPKSTVDYVGSRECKRCHASAYETWANSKHAHGYETLVKAINPGNRQYDAECVVCHVTGFGYKTGFTSEKAENFALLDNVGCESCHGPGSAHIDNTNDLKIRAAMNPWKLKPAGKPRDLDISLLCVKCHDLENDVNWNFAKRWPEIDHPSPKKGSGSGTSDANGAGSGSKRGVTAVPVSKGSGSTLKQGAKKDERKPEDGGEPPLALPDEPPKLKEKEQ
jgi:2',3'-cyclic-nucleotide 2'-phosphodiesterase (5'-nucleotidase family)